MPQNDKDITLAMILDHMRNMEQRLLGKIQDVETKLSGRMDGFEKKTNDRFDRIERKLDIVVVQISNVDERLDHAQIVEIPKLKKAVGIQ